jgi:thiamine kinase-like enzyme
MRTRFQPTAVAAAAAVAAKLACWSGPVKPQPLEGGLSNTNFLVEDRGRRFVVRVGDDAPMHGVMRFNELNVARAAHAAGLAPAIVHWQPGVLVIAHVDGRTLAPAAMRDAAMAARVADIVGRCHREAMGHLRGPVLLFWPFHLARHYAALLREGGSGRIDVLPRLLDVSARLEHVVGPVTPVLGHNDLLAANFIDDGSRLWLIDWEHGGFSSPLFDLANFASNNELPFVAETVFLSTYLGQAPDAVFRRKFAAMTCMSLLREAMWGMASELHSTIAYDFAAYADDHLARFERALARFDDEWRDK